MTTGRPTEPPSIPFDGVDEAWAISVTEHLLWSYRSLLGPSLVIEDCWLSSDLALYLRHTRGDSKLGVRFGWLGIDPTTGTTATDSARQGVYLYHSMYDTPPESKLADALGYDWWGDDPTDTDWAAAVGRAPIRTFT